METVLTPVEIPDSYRKCQIWALHKKAELYRQCSATRGRTFYKPLILNLDQFRGQMWLK